MSAEGIFAHWPNRLTALRFVGSAVLFAVFSLGDEQSLAHPALASQACFWLFIATAVTDALDGYLARRDNLVTAFGRVADPFVDKILILGTMIFLTTFEWTQGWFPAWIVVVVLAREFLVTGIRGYVESQGLEFPADWFGKTKMILQCIAIGVVLGMFAFGVHARFFEVAAHVLVWGTLITSVGSGVSYVLRTKRLLAGATS
ncbi:MAG: CDP-diacylglycerol--glycerol-3-phosphate 3-phosphatidyltransferase [Planctomycetota bacterium]